MLRKIILKGKTILRNCSSVPFVYGWVSFSICWRNNAVFSYSDAGFGSIIDLYFNEMISESLKLTFNMLTVW